MGRYCPSGHSRGRRNEIRGCQDGMLKVCVTQQPEKGKANKALVDLLSKRLGLRRSQIELIGGETASQAVSGARGNLRRSVAADRGAARRRGRVICWGCLPSPFGRGVGGEGCPAETKKHESFFSQPPSPCLPPEREGTAL